MTVLLLRGILFALLSVRSHIIRTCDIVHVRRAPDDAVLIFRPLFSLLSRTSLRFFRTDFNFSFRISFFAF